jgi:hypothetical protein
VSATHTRHHPVEPEPFSEQPEGEAANPTQLPVEPEFGAPIPPAEELEPGESPAPR